MMEWSSEGTNVFMRYICIRYLIYIHMYIFVRAYATYDTFFLIRHQTFNIANNMVE